MGEGEEQVLHRPRHRATRALTWMAIGAIATVLLALTGAWLGLSALEERPQLLSRWLGDYIKREVTLRKLEIAWSDGAPLLRISDLELTSEGDPGSAFSLDTAEVRVDAMRSLIAWSIRVQAVIIKGAQVSVQREANGTITVAGFGQRRSTSLDVTLADMLAALPENAVLGIEQAAVELQGFSPASDANQALVLYPVGARLSHDSDGVRLAVNAAMQQFPQSPIRTTIRWRERTNSVFTESDFTLSAQALPIAVLPQHLRPAGLQGKLSVAVDGQIIDHAVQTMRGTLELEQVSAARDAATLPVNGMQSLIEYVRNAAEWRLTLLQFRTRSAAGLSMPSTLTLSGKPLSAPHMLTLDHIPVRTVLPVLRILAAQSDALARITPLLALSGQIENVQLDLSGKLTALRVQQLRMQVRNVVLQSTDQHLQIGPLQASVLMHGRSGLLHMQAAPVRVDPGPDEQGKPRTLQLAASGALRWHHDENELFIDSAGVNLADGKLRMQVSGAVRIPKSRANTHIDLHLRGAGLDEPSFKRYLALDLLPAPLTTWLAKSIIAGQLRDFRADITGSPSSVVDMTELVQLQANFEDVTISYLDRWPKLTAMNGQFAMSGKQFSFNVDSARSEGARIVSTSGQIADVLHNNPLLKLRGRAAGRAEQGAAFIKATPLAQKFAPLMQQLSAQGEAALALNITVPLSSGAIGVGGQLTLTNNELRIHTLRSALSAVSGNIDFDAGGLTKATLKAHYLQREISMSLDGMLDKRQKTRLVISGATDPQGLLRHLYDVGALDSDDPAALPLVGRLTGRANWQVTLDFAQPDTADQVITMVVRSDLKGMALDLPSPMGKSMREARPLKVTSTLTGAGNLTRRFQVRYGDALHAILEMSAAQPRGFKLRRGALRLGGGDATLKSRQGISVDGSVAVISVDDWAALIAELEAQPDVPNSGNGPGKEQAQRPMDHVKSVQVQAQQMVALGAVFDNVRLDIARAELGSWLINTKGNGIDGTITIAEPIGRTPIDARFERLHVRRDQTRQTADESAQLITIDPSTLPAAQVVVQRLRYNDIELGRAKLVLEPADGGLALSEIFAIGEAFDIRGTGRWSGPADRAQSRFDLRLHSNDFGQFTKALGYGDSGIEGGAAEIAIGANWYGSPFAFALDQVHGALHFRGSNGRLRDVEPGAVGRVFGLFNLAVLPRRVLLLDFDDLFKEGVGYESIEGSFALSGGHALTENTVMHTQTAKVELKGRVGLVAQDYDQIMTVTPKVSASLPLVPIWLAEKLINRKLIDNAFAYQYIITGSWLEPDVKRILVEPQPTEIQ